MISKYTFEHPYTYKWLMSNSENMQNQFVLLAHSIQDATADCQKLEKVVEW
jgi:hypothetical protein